MIHFTLMIFSFMFGWQASAMSGEQVKSARWEHRLLAYVVTSEDERSGLETSLGEFRDGFEDRDLLLVNLGEIELEGMASIDLDEEEKEFWRRYWDFDLQETRFVLVGKDGGAKAFQRTELDLALFFDLIDTMPMRRVEMSSDG